MAHVAVVLADDFEDVEYTEPVQRLEAAGHRLTVIGKKAGATVKGKKRRAEAAVAYAAGDVAADDFDALLIPGGYSPDQLRTDDQVVALVQAFDRAGKTIAAICHGPSLLVDAEAVKGRRLTAWPSIRKDLTNAGGEVVDEPVVVDGHLITSRKPDDLSAFCDAILDRLG